MAVISFIFEETLWKRSKLRKDFRCCVCREDLFTGTKAYRPINPSTNNRRGDRMCGSCMGKKGKRLT